MVKNHLKNYQIRIRIFTKIESFLPCDTHKVSTKFHPNPSTTFEVSYKITFLALSLNGKKKKSLKNLVVGSGSRSSQKSHRFILISFWWRSWMTKYATWMTKYAWIQWPNMQFLFKFQVNGLKVEDLEIPPELLTLGLLFTFSSMLTSKIIA